QRPEVLREVDVLTGAGWRGERGGELTPLLGELPGNEVLEPGEGVGLERAPKTQTGADADVAHVVDGERDVIADDLPDRRDVLGQQFHALVGDLDPGERVHGRRRLPGAR